MTFSHRLQQGIQNATADAVIRVSMNADLPRDLVRNTESHTTDILCQAIGILPHNAVHFHTIGIIYFYGKSITDSVLL